MNIKKDCDICKICTYSATLIEKTKKKFIKSNLLYCTKIGMTINDKKVKCKLFVKAIPY